MEFLKFDCQDQECKDCSSWIGVPIERVPQPIPDMEDPGHYMDVTNTPKQTDNGEERLADDWQPRANITKLFEARELSLEDEASIAVFAENFCLRIKYVQEPIQHLTNLKFARAIRAKKRSADREFENRKGCQ